MILRRKKFVPEWPPLNGLIWLRLTCCNEEHPSRVEGFTDDDMCVIGAPNLPHTNDVDPKVAKKGFFIGWTHSKSVMEMPVSLNSTENSSISLWTIECDGETEEIQRRQFVRIDHAVEVELGLLPGAGSLRTTTVNISEGGLSCIVDRWARDPGSSSFDVTLRLPNKPIYSTGTIAWWGKENLRGQKEVGIALEHSAKTSDFLRTYIFEKQLEQRRRIREWEDD